RLRAASPPFSAVLAFFSAIGGAVEKKLPGGERTPPPPDSPPVYRPPRALSRERDARTDRLEGRPGHVLRKSASHPRPPAARAPDGRDHRAPAGCAASPRAPPAAPNPD